MVYCFLRIFELTICKALTKDSDIISYDEAMTDTDNKQEWKRVMAQEIQQLEDHSTWEQIPISNAKTKILLLTWVLCCKQSPDGEIKKLKAHICVQGNLREGDYITFAPVISWISVHIFLVLSITFHWTTCSVNFLNAFIQAMLKEATCLDSSASRFPVKRSQHLPAPEPFDLRFRLCTPSLVGAYLEGA
jgi:hypothetical protein